MARTETGSATSVEVRKTVAAPPAKVFRAWTDPKAVMRWFPPEGFEAARDHDRPASRRHSVAEAPRWCCGTIGSRTRTCATNMRRAGQRFTIHVIAENEKGGRKSAFRFSAFATS